MLVGMLLEMISICVNVLTFYWSKTINCCSDDV